MTTVVPGAPGAPVAVSSATQQGQLKPPSAGGAAFLYAVVSNVTPWLCQVQGAETKTLQPFLQDVLQVLPGQSINYIMTTAQGLPATASGPAYLQVDWYYGEPEGSFPFSFTAQALASIAGTITTITPAQLVYSGSLAALNGRTVPTVPLAAGARALVVVPSGTTQASALDLSGAVSAADWLNVQTPGWNLSAVEPRFVPFDSTIDPQLVGTATGPGSVTIYALGDLVPPGSYPVGTGVNVAQNGFLVMGTDGFKLYKILVDSQGRLILGTDTGTAIPDEALMVGGSDGTNVQALAVTAPGAAVPAEVQVVQTCSDGTNSHLLASDASGNGKVLVTAPAGYKTAISTAQAIAAGGTSSIIAGSVGKVITVYGVSGGFAPAAVTLGAYGGTLRSDSTSAPVAATRSRVMTAVGDTKLVFEPTPPAGLALPSGEGLQFFALAANAANVDLALVVYYTQA